MKLSKKWMVAIASAVLAGVMATGAAFAATEKSTQPPATASPGMQDLMKEIWALRKSRMEQLKADVDALIDKARTEGKITPEEATQLKERGKQIHRGPKGSAPGKCQGDAHFGRNMTEEQVKAKLSAAVKAGKITQTQADQMLKRWQERHARKAPETH